MASVMPSAFSFMYYGWMFVVFSFPRRIADEICRNSMGSREGVMGCCISKSLFRTSSESR